MAKKARKNQETDFAHYFLFVYTTNFLNLPKDVE
jgi:hypothetical protein